MILKSVSALVKWGGVALGVLMAANYAVPNSIWLEYESVTVIDSDYGRPVTLVPVRNVNRPVFVNYAVVVRRVGETVPVCIQPRGGGFTYRPNIDESGNRTQPGTMSLEVWTDGKCTGASFQPGFYRITTEWIFDRPWPLSDGHVIMDSNIFEVRPK